MATFDIKMPKTGESVTECTITTVNVKIGDMIEEDDTLFEVTSAKTAAPIPSPVAGKVIKINYNEGDTVPVGEIVVVVSLDGEDAEETPKTNATPKNEQKEEAPKATNTIKKGSGQRWYSPVVLEKAKAAKISQEELDTIPGNGFEGRLTKLDIVHYIEQKKGAPAPDPARRQANKAASTSIDVVLPAYLQQPEVTVGPEDTVIPMDPIRRIISDRMSQSKHTSPHVTNVIKVDVTNLVLWRESVKEELKNKQGVSLTYMAPIVEAVAHALKEYPRVNASVDGYNIIERKHINVGMAVSLNDGNLIVPVIKDADRLNMAGLADAITTLAAKGRAGKLTPDEMSGGTFTISNFGSFKSLFGTPIINQPEVAILGVGTIEKEPAVLETENGPAIAIRHMLYLSLSYDHRIIDGMLGGNFLYTIAQYLQNWKR